MTSYIKIFLFVAFVVQQSTCRLIPGNEVVGQKLTSKVSETKSNTGERLASIGRKSMLRAYMADYEARVAEYVQEQSEKYGVPVEWYDMYGENPVIVDNPDYHKYKVYVSVDNEDFNNNSTDDDITTGYTYTQTFTNKGTQPIKSVFDKTTEQENSLTWTLEAGVKIKTNVTITCKIPLIFEYDHTYSAELDVNLAASKTETEAESYSVYYELTVPPMTELTAEFIIEDQKMVVPWTADVAIDGYIAIWFRDQVDGHWLWFHPVAETANEEFPLYKDGVKAGVGGDFIGKKGVNHYLTVEENPIEGDKNIPGKKTVIPL